MQGRDPDDEGAPGQGPPPEPARHLPQQPPYGGFAVPDNPYELAEADETGGAADEVTSRDAPGPSPKQDTSREQRTAPDQHGAPERPDVSPRGLFEPRRRMEAWHPYPYPYPRSDPNPPSGHQWSAPPGRPRSEAEATTEAFRPASREAHRPLPPPEGDAAGESARSGRETPVTEGNAAAETEQFHDVRTAQGTPGPTASPPTDSGEGQPDRDTSDRVRPYASPESHGEPPTETRLSTQPPAHSQFGQRLATPPHRYPERGGAVPASQGARSNQPSPSYDVADIYAGPKKPRPGLVVASMAVVAVLILGGGVFTYATFLRDGSGPAPISAPSASGGNNAAGTSPLPNPPPSPSFDPARIRSVQQDPKPLRLREAFPEKVVTVGGREFERVAMDMAGKCAKAGQRRFDKALRRADCRRVLRATFVDMRSQYAVTTGVAVLPTRADAKKVETAAKPGKNIWFAALPGPKGSGAEKIHRSGGYSALEVIGHYAVFSFAVYADKITLPPDSRDLSGICGRMRDYTAEPIVARGLVTPAPDG